MYMHEALCNGSDKDTSLAAPQANWEVTTWSRLEILKPKTNVFLTYHSSYHSVFSFSCKSLIQKLCRYGTCL